MMKPTVVRRVELPPADAVAALEKYGVSTVHEAQGRNGLLASYMRPIYAGAAIAGPAVTVSLPPGDNLMIHVAVEVCTPGSILVVVPTSLCTGRIFWRAACDLASCTRGERSGDRSRMPRRRAPDRNEIPDLEPRHQLAGTVKATLGSVTCRSCAGASDRTGRRYCGGRRWRGRRQTD